LAVSYFVRPPFFLWSRFFVLRVSTGEEFSVSHGLAKCLCGFDACFEIHVAFFLSSVLTGFWTSLFCLHALVISVPLESIFRLTTTSQVVSVSWYAWYAFFSPHISINIELTTIRPRVARACFQSALCWIPIIHNLVVVVGIQVALKDARCCGEK
jgi:hypothetical protein